MLISKRQNRNLHRRLLGISEQGDNPLPELRRAQIRGVEQVVGMFADRRQKLPLHHQSLRQRINLPVDQGMRAARFLVAAQQHVVGRIEKKNLDRISRLRERLYRLPYIARIGVAADVEHRGKPSRPARFPAPFEEIEQQLRRNVIETEIADILQRVNSL